MGGRATAFIVNGQFSFSILLMSLHTCSIIHWETFNFYHPTIFHLFVLIFLTFRSWLSF